MNNPKTVIAAVLIILGLVILACSGISFTTPGKSVDFLGLQIQTTDSHFISPVVGIVAIVIGIVLLLINPKRT